jgi:hypothetical protein
MGLFTSLGEGEETPILLGQSVTIYELTDAQ